MQINYLSSAEESSFGEMIHSGSELSELFGAFALQMNMDSDYDTFMISFDDDNVLRIVVEDSPYVVVMDEDSQIITLYLNEYGELIEDGEYDFDEDGIETITDLIASRILGDEDYRSEMIHYGV